MQRVVRGLLRHLVLTAPAGRQVIPVTAGRWLGYRYASSFLERLDLPAPQLSGRVQPRAGDVFLELDLASPILPRHRSQLAGWKRTGVRFYFVVHDLLPLAHPEWFTTRGARNFTRWTDSLVELADGVICSTRTVADEARALFGKATDWVHLGADLDGSVPSRGLPPGFEKKLQDFHGVLMVGRIEPRKAHAQALSAFEVLWQRGSNVQLAIVGNVGWNIQALAERLRAHPENGRRLHWFEGLSDEALARLYERADGVLLCSQGEGFGLPLVEAARFGKPILARDLPVYREIAGEHASYFSGDDAAALAATIERWLGSEAPLPTGMTLSTWAEAARRLHELIR